MEPSAAGAAPVGGAAGQAGAAIGGGPSPQAGSGVSGTSGNAGAAGAGARAGAAAGATAAGDPCTYSVNGGVPVSGAGCKQQWEGIVMTMGGRGLCTAAFISERHLISASHCYARDGAVSLQVSAPTWDDGDNHMFQAQVKRSGSDQTLDVSIIDLGEPVEWATPERRFVLHAGKASAVEMHLYGFGSGGSSGAAGTLRGIPERATISVTDKGGGTLSGKAGNAQLCTGDSGGPAFVEKTAAVLYGINQAIVPSGFGGGRTCAGPDWTIMFTNVSQYMVFVEEALGKPCMRKQVDDLDVAQCW
ncbi:MAG: trypsin-like serine protease [Polyangiales bacterium]